jgi:prepilin-type N-terminal cleavage/methylation domain-containing protein
MKRGFTLLELVVVVIIIGILATLGFTQYGKVIEKGRIAEARMVLGAIRNAQEAYKQEYGDYSINATLLQVSFPAGTNSSCANTSYYYQYDVTGSGEAAAFRCGSGGKNPNATVTYEINLGYANGSFAGNLSGYY